MNFELIDDCEIIQLSMVGTNANMRFDTRFDSTLSDMWSCRLHVVHGAFQAGHKLVRCKVNVILRSFYKLFKDSPARRADYQKIIGIKLFPLKILFHKMDWKHGSCTKVIRNMRKYQNMCEREQIVWKRYIWCCFGCCQ